MRTLLVLAQHPELAEQVRASVNAENYRVIHRLNADEAEPLLAHGLADACLVDVESSNVQGIWLIEKLHRLGIACPILIYTGLQPWDWEEEAYANGVAHVLRKPVRARILNTLLERLWPQPPAVPAAHPPALFEPGETKAAEPAPLGVHNVSQSLKVLRDFSCVLTHSLCAEPMLKQFLLLIREIIGVNRAAIFLRRPSGIFSGAPARQEGRQLRSACAIGLSPGLLEHFELSFETGIGGHLFRQGRILRRHSPEALADLQMQKEFELLSAQVAIPILDRETLVGVAVFDRRVTGEPIANPELELIFHLLEELGLAVRNIWLHDQLAASYRTLADILRELSSACVVVSHDLNILHANRTARKYFARKAQPGTDLEFSDLPQALGAKVYQVLKTGTAVGPFKYQPEEAPNTVYNVSIVPLPGQDSAVPYSALLTVENLTQTEQLQRLEIETANLRLMKTMAERLAHEIGNTLVPLSTYQQLLGEKDKDPEFRASLSTALADGVKRVTRLTDQMRFLARDAVVSQETFPLGPLIEEAFREAQRHQPVKSAQLKYEHEKEPIIVSGDRAALKHALAEVMLNALQANPADARVGVRMRTESNGNGCQGLQIEVQDNGTGFTAETAQKATAPFFTTRNVGIGLGLTVSRKIVETHRGKLEILSPKTGQAGVVRISLPLETGLIVKA